MVGWFGAAALALVGGLKGQGNPWKQIPLVGVLAATALFISWRVRHGRDKDPSPPSTPDEKTVAEVNTRVYLVYDEERKLESSMSPCSCEDDPEKLRGTDDSCSSLVEIEEISNKSPSLRGQNDECRDVEEIAKSETTPASKRNSPASNNTDITVSGFESRQLFTRPEVPSIVVEDPEPYVYDLDLHSVQDATDGSLSYSAVSGLTEQEKDIPTVIVSEVASNGAPADDFLTVFLPGRDPKQDEVLNVVTSEDVDRSAAAVGDEIESEVIVTSGKSQQSSRVGASSTASPKIPGVRNKGTVSLMKSPRLRDVRTTRVSPELQLNDWVSRRGDSELEDGRLNNPALLAGKSDPSNPGPFPFSNYSASESCSSEVMDYKDEFLSPSAPNNVKRVISDVKDSEPESVKSTEEEYSERLRSYDAYLGDPSLSPTMRSQVLRAKATIERLLYDSD